MATRFAPSVSLHRVPMLIFKYQSTKWNHPYFAEAVDVGNI